MTKRELIQFMDELVELASEENKSRAILVKEKLINDFEKNYGLIMDELYLSCGNGDIDWLNMAIWCAGEKCATGNIEITYGFVDFDDDGGIGDSCDEDISYQTSGIIEFIEEIVNELEEYVSEQLRIIEKFKENFDI